MNVRYPVDEVTIADPVLRALIRQQIAIATQKIDDPIPYSAFSPTRFLAIKGFNAGVADLAGLEEVAGLFFLFLGSNWVSDLTPLSGLDRLRGVDLSGNLVSDLSPLIGKPGSKPWIALTNNPLTQESLNLHIPALRDDHWRVWLDSVAWVVVAEDGESTFETTRYFESLLGSGLRFQATADPPSSRPSRWTAAYSQCRPASRRGS